jgi:hypothetical protein
VKSIYKCIVSSGVRVSKEIWRMKLPLKIKIFTWFLKKKDILTKYNVAKK